MAMFIIGSRNVDTGAGACCCINCSLVSLASFSTLTSCIQRKETRASTGRSSHWPRDCDVWCCWRSILLQLYPTREEGCDCQSYRTQRIFVLLKKNSPITSGHKASLCYKETEPLLLINIIYYLFKNSFLHLYMWADRVNAGNLQTKGTTGKLGEATRKRKEAHPKLVPLTSTTQKGDEWNAGEHASATGGH